MDMSPYRDLFVSEARSHLSAFGELIVHIEKSAADPAALDELFRHAHSMKGMAATMGYEHIVALAHIMENQLSRIRSGEFPLQSVIADLLLEGSDTLARLVAEIEAGSSTSEDTTGLIRRLATFDPSAKAPTISKTPHEGTEAPPEPIAAAPHQFRQTDSFKSIRIRTETLDHLVNITGELITNRYRLAEAIGLADATECREPLHQLTGLLRALRDEVFKARMLPFAIIAERFPRLVRDLARKQRKDVDFQLVGNEIELDRGILEEIAEPIIHILRNAVDHGLETAAERVAAGKSAAGTVTMTVCRDQDHVEIIIADDGRGMDPERLKQKAVERGIISPERAAQMTTQDAYQLICAPGFSTAATVTDISGRGVGMDAVREAVQTLVGVLTIHSTSGRGSRFVMRLPITVSIINALIVQCGQFDLALPLNAVARTMELKRTEILENAGSPTILVDGAQIPLRSLRQSLGLPAPAEAEDALTTTVLCDVGGTLLAFSVDHISGQQEIFVRPLRSPLSRLRGVSGATITGDGRVLFIVDVSALA
ncbi:MAG: chemotaxis protein CheA [Desulfuromonadaceae bacterium]|nr:chemotaxis protein CheA [Desulfuromonadaceae bacterium]MDD2849661.1 chemotaxis protein CheA [Desulfuromonadaceae bacterium]MDD4131667.1 chemotaxis protein CheA [Desulfuromonadaceae bacterium]